jgi:penicillin-binding protein 1C
MREKFHHSSCTAVVHAAVYDLPMLPLFLQRLLHSRFFRWACGLALLFAAGWYGLPWMVDLPAGLSAPPVPGRIYQASDGTPLRHFLDEKGQRSGVEATFAQLPEPLVHAILAAEDHRFFSHGGVDWTAVTRAVFRNLKAGRITSGASTLTQQLIKLSSPPSPRTLATKVREALLARRLEMTWSKQQIFAAYANRVPFGNLFIGCTTAADGYFHKPLSDLTDAECAFLAALPQAPGRMNPFHDAQPALVRQQRIITQLHKLGWLEGEAYTVAKDQLIKLQRFRGGFVAPHAIGLIETSQVPADSAVIKTTIDAPLQRRIESIIANRLDGLRDRHVDHAAALVLENATGHILALVGSRDYFAPDGGQINGAWAPHSPGSALKPFTYALALERGHTPASIIPDLPIEYQTSTGLYRPDNYDHKHYGPMTLRYALGNSLNISAVRLLHELGGPAPLHSLLQNLGLTTLTESPDHYGLGLTIGNAPVRLIELTNAYATLARQGDYQPWTLLANSSPAPRPSPLSATTCWQIADILSDNNARTITFGPNSPLRLPFRVAVKTGTSTNYRDNWTLGFTPEYTVGVWAGNFAAQPMDDVTGVTGAGPIFRDIFLTLNDRHRVTWFAKPAAAQTQRIDPRNGKLISQLRPPPRMSREETFIGHHLPASATTSDYDTNGRAILAPDYNEWIKSPENYLGDLVTSAVNRSDSPAPLRIINPTDGLVIRLDPDIPGSQDLVLRAQPSAGVEWQSPTLTLRRQGAQTIAVLTKGNHEIIARQGEREARAHIRIE